MFAYCLNNPVNFVDSNGRSSEALQWWSGTMWWLCGVDLAVPIGDIIYVGGIVILGIIAVATIQDAPPEIAYDIVDESCEPPSPKKMMMTMMTMITTMMIATLQVDKKSGKAKEVLQETTNHKTSNSTTQQRVSLKK